MIPLERAVRIAQKYLRPLDAVRVPLKNALGLCLAEDVRADRDLPPAARSAMDGYAVRASDLASFPGQLRLAGEVAAGREPRLAVRPGTCARIFTGANVPAGADTVVMVEQTRENNGDVIFLSRTDPGANIFRRAEDARKNQVLLQKGTTIGAAQTGVCAAVGKKDLKVHRRPRVALLCTGEELRGVGDRVRSCEIRNSNGPALAAALETWGYGAEHEDRVPDDPGILTARLKPLALNFDVVILTGGMSKGRYDFVRPAVERIGAAVRFHGVAIKPGKPTLYATGPEGSHIFGLPGIPSAP